MLCGPDLQNARWNAVYSKVSEEYLHAEKYGGKQTGEVSIYQIVSLRGSKQSMHITEINKTGFSVWTRIKLHATTMSILTRVTR